MKKIRIRTTKGKCVKYLKIHDMLNTITWTPTESKALLFEDVDKALGFIRDNKKEKTWFVDILTWDKYGMMDISNAWA
jgi:hypothetical protein